jgi:hypothetical protein
MEEQTAPQTPAPKKKRIATWLVSVLIVVGLAVISAYIVVHIRCFTVGETWKFARLLNGSRICVTGKAETDVYQSMVLCDPPRCDCNVSSGTLTLVSEEGIVRNPRVATVDMVTIFSPICSGDECTITCTPINPFASNRYRFVGRLAIRFLSDGRLSYLELKDVDIAASRQRVDGEWQAIPTGAFDMTR